MNPFFLGLDLGQVNDPTALAVVERTGARPKLNYGVRNLKRWPLGTPYPAIVGDVKAMTSKPPLAGCHLAIDHTGAGRPVVDLFAVAGLCVTLVPVTFTAGGKATQHPDGWHVGKTLLVSTLQVLLQSRRLKVAAVPERETLMRELAAFRVKVTLAGNETFEAWRERDHDDILFAAALACWAGETATEPTVDRPLVLYAPGWPPPRATEADPPATDEERREQEREQIEAERKAGYVRVCGVPIKLEEEEADWWGRER